MNQLEAAEILRGQLARYGQGSHAELVPLVKGHHVDHFEVDGQCGARYQVEVQFLWDHEPDGDIRILGSIDDGGVRAFWPLCDSTIVAGPERSSR